jgi:hypothetical protein
MTLDQMALPQSLPPAIRSRTELARAIRQNDSMLALAEGLTILASGGSFNEAFRSPVTLRRIEQRGGAAAFASYQAAIAKLEKNLSAAPSSLELSTTEDE